MAKEKSLDITHKEVRQLNLSNPPAVLSLDLLLTWHSEIAKTDCQCRLRIYKITFEKVVVIVSELPENPGLTITDEGLTLIHLVCHKLALKPTKTMWLQHYPKGYLKDEETYEQVMLVQGNIYSTRINKQKIEALLGIKLEL